VLPDVEPGYLQEHLPTEMPEQPESWQEIMEDLKKYIIPGLTHWQSPRFHAFYPSQTSFPAIIGEMLSAGIGMSRFLLCFKFLFDFHSSFLSLSSLGVVGFNWVCIIKSRLRCKFFHPIFSMKDLLDVFILSIRIVS
jgi:hypothetical protein